MDAMKKQALTRRLARDARLSQPAAADLVDRVVADLVKELKKGQPVSVPGLGTLHPDRWAPRKLSAVVTARPGRKGVVP